MLAAVKSYRENYDEFDIDLRECRYLGEGHNGTVYLMPGGKAIKIFKEKKCCKNEYFILKSVNGSSHFPKVYSYGENYIIRDYVGGTCAKDYIKENGLTGALSKNLIELVEEFRKLRFTKLDIRCRDLYVQEDESIIVIDPKSSYTRRVDFPRHLAKGLKKLEVLDEFLDIVKKERPDLYGDWTLKLCKAGVLREANLPKGPG